MERKLYYKKLIVFVLPWLLIIGGICSISLPAEFQYTYLKDNCSSQSLWIYKRLFLDTAKIDRIFFGSSHVLRGINDSLMTVSEKNKVTVNFAYCRFGRDIQYELFRQSLFHKKIKLAFFEITETESSYSHPDYPFLAQGSDIFILSFIYNQDFYKNRCDAFLLRLIYLRTKIYGDNTSTPLNSLKSHGFINAFGKASAAFLNSQKEEKLKDLKTYNAQTTARKTELSFSNYYLTKIKELASKNNCKVYFIYLPAYGNEAKNSLDSAFYNHYFKTLIPPDSILNNQANWQDEAHFNNEGAEKLTKWLIEILKKE